MNRRNEIPILLQKGDVEIQINISRSTLVPTYLTSAVSGTFSVRGLYFYVCLLLTSLSHCWQPHLNVQFADEPDGRYKASDICHVRRFVPAICFCEIADSHAVANNS